jgi:hypothetical protein
MNGPDLRFLAERASGLDDRTVERLARVHDRIAVARERRRTTAAMGVAGLVLAVLVALALVQHDRDRSSPGPITKQTTTATAGAAAGPPPPATGTCWTVPADRTSTGQVEHDDSQQVPCAQPHTTETVATFTLSAPTAAEAAQVGDSCGAQAAEYLGIYNDSWVDWEAALFLPSKEQIDQGASWVRCDAFVPGPWWTPISHAPRNAVTVTSSVRDLVDRATSAFWTCLAQPPDQDQPKVPCDRPHAYEATGTLAGLGALASYPSAQELRTEAQADCAPAVPKRLEGAAVTALWGSKDEFYSGLVRGICFVFDRTGRPLPPR